VRRPPRENDQSMLPKRLHPVRRPIIIALHLALIPLGYLGAFALRFDLAIPAAYLELFAATVLLLIPIRFASFALFGVHRGWWRHVGMRDLTDLLKAITLSSAFFVTALVIHSVTPWGAGSVQMPKSVLLLDWILALLVFGGARFMVRGAREARLGRSHVERRGRHALVIGAGEAADRLLKQIGTGGTGLCPVGLVDDDPLKSRMRLQGVPVLGGTQDIKRLVQEHGVEVLVIAIPSASRRVMKRIVECCAPTGVEFKIVPSLQELLNGSAQVTQLRDVEPADLLGRDAVHLDLAEVRADLRGRTVLVTGGAGSIGSELARQVAGYEPALLVLVDQAESPLYFVDLEIRQSHPDVELVPLVADVTDQGRMDQIFSRYRPSHVFHAAAYKHVPMMESNVVEAVHNNVFGTFTVAQAAVRHGARKFILISSDKAVRPANVMGASKRVAERIVLGWPELRSSATDFRAVRFGNVLGSDGSVIPLFRKQIAAGGPVTITHSEITRYFMTIPEAVQLVLQAGTIPEAGGRISILEMGEPVRIVELAENLIRLTGLEPYADIPIAVTGLRPGEKLHEELMSEVEESVPTSVAKIRVVQTDEMDAGSIEAGLDRLGAAVEIGDGDDLIDGICVLVPECVSPLRDRRRSVLEVATRIVV
jgi:FlaA1/EpsC-like NDP-sugar epimerase